jgi:glucokinase
MMSEFLLALDFGGTKLTAALTTMSDVSKGNKAWRGHRRVFSPAGTDARYDLAMMVDLGRALLAGAEAAAIGVSFGGPVDFAAGTVRLSHHVPGWENTLLQQILEGEFGAPARVDNDANVAALGEHRFGAGQGYDDLLYITISTGVGGGWILHGRPWRGREGMAGEIGHTVIDPAGPLCLCGKHGCLERLASGPYMAQQAEEALARQPQRETVLRAARGALTGQLLAEAAGQGDGLALEVLTRSAWALGVGIGNAANLINPQLFVLGGGVTKAGEPWWTVVRRAARETALPEVHFDIAPAALGDDAPLWGAIALAQDASQ